MKWIFSALALAGAFLLVPTAPAQTTTITASNIGDVGGNLTTGSFCVTPAQQFVRGGGGNVVPIQVCYTITAGVLQTGVVLADTSLTNPVNVCYRVVIKNAYQEPQASYACMQPSGSSYSFDNFVQASPPYLNTSFTVPQFRTNGVVNSIQGSLEIDGDGVSYANGKVTIAGGGSGSPGGSPGSLQWNSAGGFAGFSGSCLPKLNGSSAPSCAVAGTDYLQGITSSLVRAALGYTPENAANKGVASGYAPLNASSVVPLANLPVIPSTQVSGLPSSLPPNGAAGGDLDGSYPSPGVGQVNGAPLPASAAYVGTNVSRQIVTVTSPLLPVNNLSDVATPATALSNLGGQAALGYTPVPNTRTVNGHALSANVVLSASDLITGTLPHPQLPTLLSADIPNNSANTSANAGTASALASIPTQCTGTEFATGIAANGDANCATPSGSGGSMTWPAAAGIMVYVGGSAYGTSLTAPTSPIVGTSDTQTLTNKTLDGVTPATMAFVDPTSSIQTQMNGKQAALGYTPLNSANNLSDVVSAPTALANLGAQAALGFTPVPNTRTVNGHALSANVSVSASDVGLSSVTNDAQTKAAIVPNTAPSAAQILVGNAGGTAYAPVSISADCALTSLGAFTCTKSNGTVFGTAAFATLGSTGSDVPQLTSGLLPSTTIPNNGANTTGTAANVTGTVAIGNGGTGATTAGAARTNLAVLPDTGANGLVVRTAAETATAVTLQPTANGNFTWTNGNGVSGNPTPAFVLPVKVWSQAAECNNATAGSAWDLPTSAAPTPACKTGTNTQQGSLGFADGNSAQFEFYLPSDWASASGFSSHVVFTSSSTSGTVIFNVAVSCTASGSTDDSAFNTATAYATITQSAASVIQNPQATSITTTGCAAGDYIHIKIARATDTASDTTVAVRGVEFDFGRTM